MQSAPHLGHIRKEVVFDVLRRWLTHSGYAVTVVANVTDIDDKILAKSAEAASRGSRTRTASSANCTPPTLRSAACRLPTSRGPRAHIPDMLELTAALIERGHAFPAADGSGDVYFDGPLLARYGELLRQKVDEMEPAADADPRGKRDPS